MIIFLMFLKQYFKLFDRVTFYCIPLASYGLHMADIIRYLERGKNSWSLKGQIFIRKSKGNTKVR